MRPGLEISNPERSLEILHRDADLIVVSKPSGLCVHRGMARDAWTVVDALRAAGLAKPHTVHRLDRQTSGALVVALTADAARSLQRAFEEGAVEKSYLALVRGQPDDHVVIDHPIPRSEGGARVPATSRMARIATRALAASALRESRYSVVRVWPETGRFHQVRRHLHHLGHPVLGDANYGRGEHNRLLRDRIGLERMALHAERIAFDHPSGKTRVDVRAPLPPNLAVPLTRLGFPEELEAV